MLMLSFFGGISNCGSVALVGGESHLSSVMTWV